jgi:pimeloyl-ACP methyl ester carboxylesterase
MMADLVPNQNTHTIKDCGHWTQQEKPDEFNRVVIDWLDETFSK